MIGLLNRQTGDVPTRPRETNDESIAKRVRCHREDDDRLDIVDAAPIPKRPKPGGLHGGGTPALYRLPSCGTPPANKVPRLALDAGDGVRAAYEHGKHHRHCGCWGVLH